MNEGVIIEGAMNERVMKVQLRERLVNEGGTVKKKRKKL